MGPIENLWDMAIPQSSKGDSRSVAQRFNSLRTSGAFLCPGNKVLAARYSGSTVDAGVGPMVSYNTQRLQLSVATEVAPGVWQWAGGFGTGYIAPNGWKPMIGRIGSPAEKIFCGDGARYSMCIEAPDYDLTPTSMGGGIDSDAGPYSAWSRSWDRCRAPGNQFAPGGHAQSNIDPRSYAYRHSMGEPPPDARANAFKANFVFYDGHVETQGDLESANPHQWLPKGTLVQPQELWPDVAASLGSDMIQIGG
jgi:prepilin-type processing-associated H-X9-DG protein